MWLVNELLIYWYLLSVLACFVFTEDNPFIIGSIMFVGAVFVDSPISAMIMLLIGGWVVSRAGLRHI